MDAVVTTRTLTLLGIDTAAHSIGVLAPGVQLESFDKGPDNRALLQLQSGIKGKLGEMGQAGVSRTSYDKLAAFAEGGVISDPDALLVAMRVAERDLHHHQRELLASAEGVTRPVPAIEDARLVELFESHRADFANNHVDALPTAYLAKGERASNPRDGFAPIIEDKTGTEVLWMRCPSDLGGLASVVTPYWMDGSVGMVIYRNERVGVVGAIQVTGAVRNDWNSLQRGAYMSLGGVMAEGMTLDQALPTVVDKANDMIKWEVINELLGADVQLGPAKSLLVYASEKYAALTIHAIVMRFLGIYIGGNDQGVYQSEAALLSAMAPRNFAGNRMADPIYRGRVPSPYTAGGVNEWLLLALREHVGDMRAPVAFQGYGGVGAPLVDMAIRQGLNISAIMDSDVAALKRAGKDINRHGFGAVPLLFDVSGARERLGGDDARLRDMVAEAERARFTLVEQGGLAGCLEKLRIMDRIPRLVSTNANAHVVGSNELDFAKTYDVAGFVGGANNPLTRESLAQRAVNHNIFIPWGPMINPMGALVVLADALGLSSERIEEANLRLRGLFYRSLAAHRRGVSPLHDGKEMVAATWNPKLSDGRAIGPRYGTA